MFFLPGVDRSRVRSLFTPNVRYTEVVEEGIAGDNVVPADFQPTPEGLARVRQNILKAGIVGRLVANDFRGALISAELLEVDPATGKKLDYLEVARLLDETIRQPFSNERTSVHIIGFAQMVGDIAAGAKRVVFFFAFAFLVTGALVYLFTRAHRVSALLVVCSLVAVVWQLGALTLLGYGIDPLGILVPFLIFAIAVSHGVQMVTAVRAEIFAGATSIEAARNSFSRLLVPGGTALLTDLAGFVTILLIKVRVIQELAIAASLGVAAIILTNLLLLPILLSFVPVPADYRQRLERRIEAMDRIWLRVALLARPKPALAVLLIAVVLTGYGAWRGSEVRIGDLRRGVPELRPDSRYNQDIETDYPAFLHRRRPADGDCRDQPGRLHRLRHHGHHRPLRLAAAEHPGGAVGHHLAAGRQAAQCRLERGEPQVAGVAARSPDPGRGGPVHPDQQRPAQR